jgi:hypothetical protein
MAGRVDAYGVAVICMCAAHCLCNQYQKYKCCTVCLHSPLSFSSVYRFTSKTEQSTHFLKGINNKRTHEQSNSDLIAAWITRSNAFNDVGLLNESFCLVVPFRLVISLALLIPARPVDEPDGAPE